MTPEKVDPWIAIFRDLVFVLLSTFILVFETVYAHSVNPLIVGAGLTLAGVPPVVRLDGRRRKKKEDTDVSSS